MLPKHKRVITLVVILLISTILSNVYFYAKSSEELEDLDSLGVDAKDASYSALDYLEGYDLTEESDPRLKELSQKTLDLASNVPSILNKIYGGKYVNPANNTLFISIIDDSSSVKEEIINQLNPDKDLTIIFRKCDYTKAQIKKMHDKIIESDLNLEYKKYKITSIMFLEEGKLLIRLNEVNTETVRAFLDSLPTSVPKDALVIRRGSLAKTASLTAYHRPLIAGIMFQGRVGLTELKTGTLGFYGTDSENDDGILTAGHCVADGWFDGAYQEVWAISGKKIGVTKEKTEAGYADAAWIELDNGVSGSKMLHPEVGGYDYIVKYQDELDDLDQGDTVKYIGFVSGYVTCHIEGKGTVWNTNASAYVFNQIILDEPCVYGDSGGPVYSQNYYMDNIFHVTAKGIMWGFDEDSGFASPIDGIEDSLDLTFDLTD